ncbi:hypothetical protein HW450_03665 [Corynebacterium hindlerae]|uniref:Uncharacterized protein n=1 Tax=Corynebacterium hindlerae TaxID=699041 RepID=A0A7G5FGV1_9CORY|nr:hypothetical protein [Corynebacterium hindlerae]QMV85842.1 hypothetical protein HW450_03665 [Corynebacterium hindlerae]
MSPETANLVLNRDRNISPITLEACETIASLNYEYAVELRISEKHWARVSRWKDSMYQLDPELITNENPWRIVRRLVGGEDVIEWGKVA